MSAFDLSDLVDFADSLMEDACTITRDTEGADDDTLDQASGQLTPVAEQAPVYFGPCDVSFVDTVAEYPEQEAGRDLAPVRFQVHIPLTAPLPLRGDIVTITTATKDPALQGKQFRVLTVGVGTQVVRRQLLCEDAW